MGNKTEKIYLFHKYYKFLTIKTKPMINFKILKTNRLKTVLILIAVASLTSCASGYRPITPQNINYLSTVENNGVTLDYKYNLLDKRYAKKEGKKGMKLVAVKLTNNSGKDLMFGRDIKLVYENGNYVNVEENEKVFQTLKQGTAGYLLYLLLTPLRFETSSSSNGVPETTSSTPIGVVIGPGLAGGNMIAAGSANKKFKDDILEYNLNGMLIKQGETKYGLIGVVTDSYDALKLKVE